MGIRISKLQHLQIQRQQIQGPHLLSYRGRLHQERWVRGGTPSGPPQSGQGHPAGRRLRAVLSLSSLIVSELLVQFQGAGAGRYAGTQYPH